MVADRNGDEFLNFDEYGRLMKPERYFDAEEFIVGKFIRGTRFGVFVNIFNKFDCLSIFSFTKPA